MKRLYYFAISFFLLGLLSCLNAESESKLDIYFYDPFSQKIALKFEVDFYNDGLIKEIRRYTHKIDYYNDYDYDTEKERLDLSQRTTVVKNQNEVLVYLSDYRKNQQKQLIRNIKIEDELLIDHYHRISRIYNVEVVDQLGSHFSSVNDKIYRKADFTDYNHLVIDYQNANSSYNYIINNDGELSSMYGVRKGSTWETEIILLEKNHYLITQYESIDGFPFKDRYEIFDPGIDIEPISRVLNISIFQGSEANYSLPFFTGFSKTKD